MRFIDQYATIQAITLHNHLLCIMGQDYSAGIAFQGSNEDRFGVCDRPCSCTGGNFIDSDDLVIPVEQKDLELLDELDLVLIPVLFEDFVNVSRSGDPGAQRSFYVRLVG